MPKRRFKKCKWCGGWFRPQGDNPGIYCSVKCKAAWQSNSREWSEHGRKHALSKPPIDEAVLRKMYVEERKTTYQIADKLGCTQWRVVKWLHAYGIPANKYPPRTGWKHSKKTREHLRQIRLKDGHVPYLKNGKHWLKGVRGPGTPSWKGGITPERQAFYATEEWKRVSRQVWKRDGGCCQRCGRCYFDDNSIPFDVHHVVSFACRELRSELSNLVLLCEKCHYWVHSRKNKKGRFIKPLP